VGVGRRPGLYSLSVWNARHHASSGARWPSGVYTEETRTSELIVGPWQGCTKVEPQRLAHHRHAQRPQLAGWLEQPPQAPKCLCL